MLLFRLNPPYQCLSLHLVSFLLLVFQTDALSTRIAGLSPPIAGPHVGYTSPQENIEFIVIGTSHFNKCQSAQEVTTLIEQVQPDGVVIELDPERVIRLTKQDAMTNDDTESTEKDWFGDDFLAAIKTAQRMDIPLFLGDEPTQQTQQRFLEKMILPTSYSPKNLLQAAVLPWTKTNGSTTAYLNLVQTFGNDPQKLLPLAATTLIPFVFLVGSLQHYKLSNGAANLSTVLSLIASFLATCKVFNSVIVDRDDLLASRAANASNVLARLKRKETIRMKWTFTVDDDHQTTDDDKTTQPLPALQGMPIFTLKTPLQKGMVRNLNLFEPRWLKMIDGLLCQANSSASTLQFGCVSCTNKFYSVITCPDTGKEGRYADLIFERQGRLALVDPNQIVEGTRPSGARKIGVPIVGGDSFTIAKEHQDVTMSKDGYMVLTCENNNDMATGRRSALELLKRNPNSSKNDSVEEDAIRVVVVVGLLHANGVIQRLSQLS